MALDTQSAALSVVISHGRLSRIIAQVRLFSEYLAKAIVEVGLFLYGLFGNYLWFQVLEVEICADMVGWDISQANWQECFISHAVGDDGCPRDEALMLESEGESSGAGIGYWDE